MFHWDVEQCLGPVAKRILPNHRSSELCRQSKAKTSSKLWIFSEIQKVFSYLHNALGPQNWCFSSRYSWECQIQWWFGALFLRVFESNLTQCIVQDLHVHDDGIWKCFLNSFLLISQLYQFWDDPTKPFSLKGSFVKSWRTVSYAIIFYRFEMDNISQLWHLLNFFITMSIVIMRGVRIHTRRQKVTRIIQPWQQHTSHWNNDLNK